MGGYPRSYNRESREEVQMQAHDRQKVMSGQGARARDPVMATLGDSAILTLTLHRESGYGNNTVVPETTINRQVGAGGTVSTSLIDLVPKSLT